VITQQISKELLEDLGKKGEVLVIWQCEKCFKTIPFYKSGNELIDTIYLWWAHDHKYCECEKEKKPKKKENDQRINDLLEKYEPLEEDYGNFDI